MASLGEMEMSNWDSKQITDQRRVNHSSSGAMGKFLSRHEGVDIYHQGDSTVLASATTQ